MPNQFLDTLSGFAPLMRVRPELQSVCRLGTRWTCEYEAERDASARFHIVTKGMCAIDLLRGDRAIPLSAGDVVVLPRGPRHVVYGSACTVGQRRSVAAEFQAGSNVEPGTDAGDVTELVCGRLTFEQAHRNLLLGVLPEAIVIGTCDGTDAARMRRLISALADEIESERAGVSAIATDLASALFVMAVRVNLERRHPDTGVLALLAHRQAGRAVAAMLSDLGRRWTLDALASSANASRASLVRMFQKLTNTPPLEFLCGLRLDLARRTLATSNLPLAEIAAEIGYQSESAFSRAFRRRFGFPPGQARGTESEAPQCARRSNDLATRFMPNRGGHGHGAAASVLGVS